MSWRRAHQLAARVKAAGQTQAMLLPLLREAPDSGDVEMEHVRSSPEVIPQRGRIYGSSS